MKGCKSGMEKLRVLNRDAIKWLAMLTMLLNHIAHTLMPEAGALRTAFIDIGYFTAITMCFFLVEGYGYTRSKKRYALRLLIFGLVSQPFFYLAFGYPTLNMMFTLLACLGILAAEEHIKNRGLRALAMIGLAAATVFSDWPLHAAAFTMLFIMCRNRGISYVWGYLLGFALFFIDGLRGGFLYSLWQSLPLLVSCLFTQVFYNGKQMEKGRSVMRWAFYLFYPVHLAVLTALKYIPHP